MLPAASAGASFHAAIASGKFHGVISATTPSGSRTVIASAAGDGDRVAEQPLRRAGVVAEGVDDHAHLAARVADRLAGVARLEDAPAPRARAVERVGEAAQQRARGRPARRARQAGQRRLGARDRGVGLLDAARAGARSSTPSVAGSMTCSVSVTALRRRRPLRRRPISRSISSIVRRGPLNQFLALTSHQMPTARNTPPVTTGV